MKKKIAVGAAVVVSFLVGIGAGATSTPPPAAAKTKTVTHTVQVSKVPDDCVIALEGWRSVSNKLNKANAELIDSARAAATGDLGTATQQMYAGSNSIKSATKEVKATVTPAHNACLAAAK
jgi:hypothetical protein